MKIEKLLLLPFLLIAILGFSQEQLIELDGNPIVSKFAKSKTAAAMTKSVTADTLSLPFFDDFSVITVYPNQEKWIGQDVFVNDTWGLNPISYGVASFDQADSVGAIRSLSASGEPSDMLTSRPIDLDYTIADSVYLSFAVQRGGNARIPEEQDSLVLMFNAPDTTWHSVWNMPGGELDTSFHYILIPIQANYLLQKGFQFRFVNYASNYANAPEPSYNSNNDIWNLDYVWLDTARSINDTIINDIAMISNFSSLITGFEAVPWKHYLQNQTEVPTDSVRFVYRSNGENEQGVNRQYVITDLWGNGAGYESIDDSENILEFETITYTKPVPYVFESDQTDTACFEIKGFISTDEEEIRKPFRWNDTVYYYQKFEHYYAYDDGVPEVGYGIGGVGTSSASLAYEFTPLVGDTLRGVNIYFNHVLNDENVNYFYLMVWDDNEGLPGDTLVYQIGVRPEFKDSLYQYRYYALDTPVYVNNTFHIGWSKTTDDMLNVGFDKNRDASDKLRINLFGEWQQSSLSGAVMIRPVFSTEPYSAIPEKERPMPDFALYPNPAQGRFYVAGGTDYERIKIVNTTGRIVYDVAKRNEYEISNLTDGLYIVLFYKQNQMIGKQKLLIRN
jgi:hypothetical protein